MYEEKNKYIDVPSDDKQLIRIEQLYDTTKESDVIRDCEHLIMLLGNLSYPKFCTGWVDVESFNKLLDKYKIDVSIYQKGVEKPKEVNPSFNYIISIIKNNNGEYKSEVIKMVLKQIPNIKKGKIRTAIRRYCKLGILEQSKHETSNKNILSKGRYWNSHIGKGA